MEDPAYSNRHFSLIRNKNTLKSNLNPKKYAFLKFKSH